MQYDYIVVGGGVAGCVVAHRIREAFTSAKVLILETGPDPKDYEFTHDTKGFPKVRGSVLDYSLNSVPQINLRGRTMKQWGGKCLGGSGSINAAGWTRGPACDFDRWAELTGDSSWNWLNMLKYFRKTENYHAEHVDERIHGQEGSLKVQVPGREETQWPMRQPLDQLWAAHGLHWNNDLNGGKPLGYGYPGSIWDDGKRQFPQMAYDLSGVEVQLCTKVHKVLFHARDGTDCARVRGVLTTDGQTILAHQVVLCAGVYFTPQILLLSGVGQPDELSKHSIEALIPNAEVGKHLRDDLNVRQVFRLTHPEKHGGVGSPNLPDVTNLVKRNPIDHFAYIQADRDAVVEALRRDGVKDPSQHPIMHPDRVHEEVYIMYLALLSGIQLQSMNLQQDGSYITTSVYNMAPTSRGSVSLNSADPDQPPLIDPRYLSTEVDRVVMRDALRRVYRLLMFSAGAGPQMVTDEVRLDKTHMPLTPALTDEEVDSRIMYCAESGTHPSGTCGMGRVIDSRLKVFGAEGLRVIDASSFPDGVSAHIQAAVYALAEKGADMIIEDASRG